MYRIDDFLLKFCRPHATFIRFTFLDFQSKFTACQFELLKILGTFENTVEEEAILGRAVQIKKRVGNDALKLGKLKTEEL